MQSQTALDEIIKTDGRISLGPVKLPTTLVIMTGGEIRHSPDQQSVDWGTEVVPEGGQSRLQFLVIDVTGLVSVNT